LKDLEDNSVDLIITSPPYADQRKSTYGGINHNEYVDWFMPISKELLRALKPTGTFILNIKKSLYTSSSKLIVVAVNGCCYGKDKKPFKAKEKNQEFEIEYSSTINKFTRDFIIRYCDSDGKINWHTLLKFNSGK